MYSLLDRGERLVDDLPRGPGRDCCDQDDLGEHRHVAGDAEREGAAQGGGLALARGAEKLVAEKPGERDDAECRAAADRSALQAEHEEMALELARDEAVLGADEMQHLDDRTVLRHG